MNQKTKKELLPQKIFVENEPMIIGGSGIIVINPMAITVPFLASNKDEDKDNEYPYFADKDIKKAKQMAEELTHRYNVHAQLIEALKNVVDFFAQYPPYFADGKSMTTDMDFSEQLAALQAAENK